MLAEVYFLRYAFPCARVLVDIRKKITEQEWLDLKNAVETNTPVNRSYLERTFTKAIAGLKKINPTNYWDIKVIREYFWHQHEKQISNDLPPMIRRLCQIKKGRLVKQFGNIFQADLGEGDIRNVMALYPDAKIGEFAMIHYGYAVEKVNF